MRLAGGFSPERNASSFSLAVVSLPTSSSLITDRTNSMRAGKGGAGQTRRFISAGGGVPQPASAVISPAATAPIMCVLIDFPVVMIRRTNGAELAEERGKARD